MAKYLVILVVIACGLYFFGQSSCIQGPGPSIMSAPSPGGKPASVKAEFDSVADQYNVVIYNWTENGDRVDFWCKSRSFNAINDFLDPLIKQKIVKDVINYSDQKTAYRRTIEEAEEMHHRYHVLRAYY